MQPFDYSFDADVAARIELGVRCVVPLGRNVRVGIVVGLNPPAIDPNKIKPIKRALTEIAPLSSHWLQFTRFAAEYYQHSWGEVALPSLPRALRSVPGARHAQSLSRLRERAQSRWAESGAPELEHTTQQAAAIDELINASGFAPHLLFGVTGSGKTEVYLSAIARRLASDPAAQALLLVPEINLTPQLESLLRARFPSEHVVALHSNLADTERAAAWLAAHEGRARIVVGTRLAVFCSMPQLSIIVVDEEHDPSYKAGEGVRYSARDLAVKRAQLLDIPIVLGSATPSIESWALAQTGRYRLLQLAERVGLGDSPQPRPSLELIDARVHKPQNGLSAPVAQALTDTFDRGEQSLGISKPSWLCAGGDMRIVRLAIELPALLDVCGVPQAGSVAALSSLRIRCPGSTRLPDVRQSALEGRGPGHAAHRRNAARLVAGSEDCAYRSRLDATASRCEESARCGACGRSRCARRHADDREGARFSARFAGRRAQSRWSAGVARLSRSGAIVCDVDAGFRPRRPRRAAEPRAGANAVSRATRCLPHWRGTTTRSLPKRSSPSAKRRACRRLRIRH